MVDSSSKKRKKIITEGDIATLLQRYDTKTILTVLQEIAYYCDTKMDWNELVKKTTTGITNAREYQLLWRHLSYRDPLLPVEVDDQPLDDDSDMECDLEASPEVSREASMEAIAHVKVLAASYVPRGSDVLDESAVEAPLSINIPYGPPEGTQVPSESPWLSRGMNVTFPVCLQKATTTERINGNGPASNSMAFGRKRKRWSREEDEELIAAVKRCGEGNWAHMVKGDFRGERTASQLSQRWALIKRRVDASTMAVNHALSLALGKKTSSCSITETQANGCNSSQGQQLSKQVGQALSQATTSVPASKTRVVKKSSTSRLDLMITANSAAAAACMGDVTARTVPKVKPGIVNAPLVPKTEPVKNASTTCMTHPLSVPKVVQGKSVAVSSVRPVCVPKVEPGKSVGSSSITKAVGPASIR